MESVYSNFRLSLFTFNFSYFSTRIKSYLIIGILFQPKVENVDIVEQTEVAPVAVPEACTNTEEAAPAAVEPVEELPSTKVLKIPNSILFL